MCKILEQYADKIKGSFSFFDRPENIPCRKKRMWITQHFAQIMIAFSPPREK